MTKNPVNSKTQFITGWRLRLLSFRFAISLLKYILNPSRYPLFSLKAIMMFRKNKVLGIHKIPKFGGKYFTAILGIPKWPSKAYDRMVTKGGLNLGASGTPQKIQINSVFMGISRECSYKCKHCYESFNLGRKKSIPTIRWKSIIDEVQQLGTSIIIFSGGEPMLEYDRILELLSHGDKELSDFHIHTSGHGVSLEKARKLKSAGLSAAGISLDDFRPEQHDSFRGFEGAFQNSINAINNFRDAGVFPYINLTLRKALIKSGGLWKFLQLARWSGAGVVQLLEPKPCGGYTYIESETQLSEDNIQTVTVFFKKANQSRKYREFPFVAYPQYYEQPEFLGCQMGGLSLLYINTQGHVQPCVFLPVSFGNILHEDFYTIYRRMREAVPYPLRKKCAVHYLAETIRKERNQGFTSSIPYASVFKEWRDMYL